jgi:photosystem II stability/assembly factor-like uncharacterized protein
MKTLLRSLIFLLLVYTTAIAQWTIKQTYSDASYLWHLEAVGDNVLWGAEVINPGVTVAFFKTTDGGNSWYNDTLEAARVVCMHARNATTAYCGIRDLSGIARIIKTTDGGLTWMIQNSAYGNADQWIERVYFFDDNNGFAFGDPIGGYNEIYTTTNGGDKWDRVPNTNIPLSLANEFAINTTWSVVGNTIWYPLSVWGSNQVRIFKSTDRGYTWTASNSFSSTLTDLYPSGIVFKNQMDGILILSRCYTDNTSAYKIFKTIDGGNTWTEMSFTLDIHPAFICDIPGTPQGYLITAPLGKVGSAYTFDGGSNWQLIENSLDLSLTTFTSSSVGWSTNWDTPNIYKWSGSELPVELNAFNVKVNGTEVTLKWSTATELNNYGFEIQRKSLSGEFATVAFVKGQGTTTQKNEYSFIDKNLDVGKYSYRLKQVDLDGKFEYSKIVEVEVISITSYSLEQNYPNPFNPSTTINYALKEKGDVKLTLLNSLGEEIAVLVNGEQDEGFHKVEFNAENFPSGVYFYKLVAGNFIDTKKMLLLK